MLLVLLKRFLGRSQSHRSKDAVPPEQMVEQIQKGDLRVRNQFIADYQPFVAKVASRFCKKYIDPSRDDEFSIGLAAFNEAINQYSATAGKSFLGFAETVIRRRLIDYIRKEQRFSQHIPYSVFEVEDDEDNIINPVEIRQALEEYDKEQDAEERGNEIQELNGSLGKFDICFSDLVKISPKHIDSRQTLHHIGRLLSEDSELMSQLLQKRMLPIKELLDKVKISRKTLERNRKYIIAIALIFHGPYPHLKQYLQPDNRTMERGEEE
ncbi:RNA polymerase sigma factor SigI [Paenibacillus sp. J2TS4]|uniref:RNA polymerase sigma factor SigI n=1 Tax=Paenibacillus sp. J2TS4 TaxID=2807194 RepID=UPI001B0DF144|nr:RNA polymerase sigma factor SigI [Paenibacillus sp. J2TS4]GIP34434.1 RNA polymerase sigma factor SigI [Paenibacillus sp. J2TS4]